MKLLTFAATAWLLAGSTAWADVQVTIRDGLVTVIAKDATIRQIMAEWARVGQAKVVNAERIPGGPVTLELVNVPEAQVLDTLLRSAAGYLAAPRAVAVSNLSQFDRIIVMPTSSAPRAPVGAAPPTFPQPQLPQPPGDDEDERPNPNAPNPNLPMPNPRGPVFNTFPPTVVNPQQVVTPSAFGVPGQVPTAQPIDQQPPVTYPSTPTAPFGGVAVPGMVAPPPQQPGQILQPQSVQPGQPGQVVTPVQPGPPRRPDGQS
jgi:hypothetical protein